MAPLSSASHPTDVFFPVKLLLVSVFSHYVPRFILISGFFSHPHAAAFFVVEGEAGMERGWGSGGVCREI